ncbi:MAG: methyltransferase domain-containing protein [Rhodothermales bacterium]
MIDPWYLEQLVCPVDKTPLRVVDGALASQGGRTYPVVDGIPVMLVEEAEQTIGVASSSLAAARDGLKGEKRDDLYLDTLGISEREKAELAEMAARENHPIDPVVAFMVAATSGFTYKHLVGKLSAYPIPELRLPPGGGAPLLDLGCNWGRWCVAAARKGYTVTGIDPSLGAVMAARRVARQMGLPIRGVVADARYLPFREASYEAVFSYSVLQHLSKDNVGVVLAEIERVLRPGGRSLIQMPHRIGVRSLYHQARRRFREPKDFEVRYWSVGELRERFEELVGPSDVSVDCYFGLGLQKSDRHLMPPTYRLAIDASERLRSASRRVGALTYLADSVYVESVKAA